MNPKKSNYKFGLKFNKYFLLKLFIVTLVFGLGIFYVGIDNIGDASISIKNDTLLTTQCSVFIGYILTSFAFKMILDDKINFKHTFEAVLISSGLNILLPLKSSELVRIGIVKKNSNIGYTKIILATFTEKLYDIIIIGVLITFFFLNINGAVESFICLFLLYFLALSVLGFFKGYLRRINLVFTKLDNYSILSRFHKCIQQFNGNDVNVGRVYFVGFIRLFVWCSLAFTFYIFILYETGVDLYIRQIVGLVLIGSAGIALGVLPGGLGTLEAGLTYGFYWIGFDLNQSIQLSIIFRLLNMVFIFPLSLLLAAYNGIGFTNLIKDARIAFVRYKTK